MDEKDEFELALVEALLQMLYNDNLITSVEMEAILAEYISILQKEKCNEE